MLVLDSSVWLEWLHGGDVPNEYIAALKERDSVVTPTVAIYEVYKILRRADSDHDALAAAALMAKRDPVALTSDLAVIAARNSVEHKLSMADAIIYASAQVHSAELVTYDRHFQNLPGVTYLPKERA